MYFRLNPECYLIRGEKCGAIYDLLSEKIYSLSQEEAEILTSCEKNNQVREDEKFLGELKELTLGNFYPNPVYIQKLRAGSMISAHEIGSPPKFDRAFLEINNSCERECWFCGFNGMKRSLGCMGCNKWKEEGESLTLERWKEIIDELKDLNCSSIFIKGGDLTLDWDKTTGILDYADGKFTSLYITLHQQSLTREIINDLYDLGDRVHLIIQTENVNTPSASNNLTSTLKPLSTLNHSSSASKNTPSFDYTYLLVLKPENWGDALKIGGKLKIEGKVITDFTIKEENSLEDLPLMEKKEFPPVNMYQFLDNLEYHPCLGHSLTITYNGNVLPCPLMRHYVLDNVQNQRLYSIFQEQMEKIDKFWKLNLDKIERCTSCQFRYACTDCRALEESLTGRLNGKRLCNYNPQEGKEL